jgi:hypothetical protein
MLEALKSAESKLREYYSRTDNPELGDIYAHSIILAPQHKLEFFRGQDWTDQDYASLYLESFKDRMKEYQTESDLISKPRASMETELDEMLNIEMRSIQDQDELTRFLQGGKLLFSLFSYFSLTFFSLFCPFILSSICPPLPLITFLFRPSA